MLDSFCNNVLFYAGGYYGNPLEVHKTMHHFMNLKNEDFGHWRKLFNETVDELFEGEKAELAKQRAFSIATIMRIKILRAKEGKDTLKDLRN